MSVHVIKAITRRIRLRMGSTANAAMAAGVSPGVFSHYENDDHPDTTIPLHRFLMAANAEEREALIELLKGDTGAPRADLGTEASETIESAVDMGRMIRLATADGKVTETEARPIRAKALETIAQAGDVLKALG
ncbi:hypothetical protein [Brevundimonas sp.]|uniref:hypothetical protein n=1 Tax=Brevundimonas sp. TaxID=1871086 RepID=UPI002D354B89|nr:hypothetical protein [Brevundimonas sp.]HYC66668.1 hypothetical protein [Brevundimonas sp.]